MRGPSWLLFYFKQYGGMKMSKVFKNTLKSFKSDITGEEKEYKVNNAVWLFMESLFDMGQSEFDEELQGNENIAMAKFVTAVLKANELDVTYEEVAKNTDPKGVIKFYSDFFDIAFGEKETPKERVETAKKTKKETSK